MMHNEVPGPDSASGRDPQSEKVVTTAPCFGRLSTIVDRKSWLIVSGSRSDC